jgi:hypothetical protein
MEAEDWVKAKAIFDAAIEVASDQRKAFLDNACAGDKELRREIEALLASAEAAGSFMEMPFAGQIGNLLISSNRDRISTVTRSFIKLVRAEWAKSILLKTVF